MDTHSFKPEESGASLQELDRDHLTRTLETVYLARLMDDKMAKLVRQNKGATFQLSVSGHELIGALSALALISGCDWAFPYYRDRSFAWVLDVLLKI